MMTTHSPMPFAQLEQAYQGLSDAIDQAGAANESLFLTKLAMVLAHRLGDIDVFHDSLRIVMSDLESEMPR